MKLTPRFKGKQEVTDTTSTQTLKGLFKVLESSFVSY